MYNRPLYHVIYLRTFVAQINSDRISFAGPLVSAAIVLTRYRRFTASADFTNVMSAKLHVSQF